MTIEKARASVGKMVMSRDPGSKPGRATPVPHGPYLLKHVKKSGHAILEKPDGDMSVAPIYLTLAKTK